MRSLFGLLTVGIFLWRRLHTALPAAPSNANDPFEPLNAVLTAMTGDLLISVLIAACVIGIVSLIRSLFR